MRDKMTLLEGIAFANIYWVREVKRVRGQSLKSPFGHLGVRELTGNKTKTRGREGKKEMRRADLNNLVKKGKE